VKGVITMGDDIVFPANMISNGKKSLFLREIEPEGWAMTASEWEITGKNTFTFEFELEETKNPKV